MFRPLKHWTTKVHYTHDIIHVYIVRVNKDSLLQCFISYDKVEHQISYAIIGLKRTKKKVFSNKCKSEPQILL